MSETVFIPAGTVSQVEMLPGVHRRTIGTTDRVMICEILMIREAVVPTHSHPHDQVGYLIYGRLELTVAAEVRVCQPGDSWQIMGGVPHSARALVDSLVIDVFAPARDEYRNPPSGR